MITAIRLTIGCQLRFLCPLQVRSTSIPCQAYAQGKCKTSAVSPVQNGPKNAVAHDCRGVGSLVLINPISLSLHSSSVSSSDPNVLLTSSCSQLFGGLFVKDLALHFCIYIFKVLRIPGGSIIGIRARAPVMESNA